MTASFISCRLGQSLLTLVLNLARCGEPFDLWRAKDLLNIAGVYGAKTASRAGADTESQSLASNIWTIIMPRTEFTRKTRRDALRRADGACEASGPRYSLAEGTRCNAPLSYGVEFDHDVPNELGGDNSLENCRAICIRCHKAKTRLDIGSIRKADRARDKATGAKQSRNPVPGSRNTKWRKRMDGSVERRNP